MDKFHIDIYSMHLESRFSFHADFNTSNVLADNVHSYHHYLLPLTPLTQLTLQLPHQQHADRRAVSSQL